MSAAVQNDPASMYAGWKSVVGKYTRPNVKQSVWQIVNSFGGLLLMWILTVYSLQVGYWLTLLLAIPMAGFTVRIFIIQHDCGHGSFFKSQRANEITGIFASLFTFVAYKYWRKSHAIHHAHHAELEERGTGDVWTMTVDEYYAAPGWKRVAYRIFRNPFFLFGVAPTINFLVLERFPISADATYRHGERSSVWWTDLALLGFYTALGALIGFGNMLLILLPVMVLASSAGVWLFYVQHQFERTYWEHTPEWDYTLAAMHGSSYYELPRVLQWFTGNIGFHHIHHLSPRIPNYNLERCHKENPVMQRVVKLNLRKSFSTVRFALWDEQKDRLVTFAEAAAERATVNASSVQSAGNA